MKEFIAQNFQEAYQLSNYGVKNIELISNWDQGGLTPDADTLFEVAQLKNLNVEVMVRPRGGNFVYNKKMQAQIKETIEFLYSLGYNHIVFGCLTKNNDIDVELLTKVMKWKKNMKITFHRAVELTNDFEYSIELLSKLNCDYILTSGPSNNFEENIKIISKINKNLQNSNTQIIFGGGIDKENFKTIYYKNNINNFHIGSAIRVENKKISKDKVIYFNEV